MLLTNLSRMVETFTFCITKIEMGDVDYQPTATTIWFQYTSAPRGTWEIQATKRTQFDFKGCCDGGSLQFKNGLCCFLEVGPKQNNPKKDIEGEDALTF